MLEKGFISKLCRHCISSQTRKDMQTQRFQKSAMVEARIFHKLADKTFLIIIIPRERKKQAREDLQFLTVSGIFSDHKIGKVGLIVKFYKHFSQ